MHLRPCCFHLARIMSDPSPSEAADAAPRVDMSDNPLLYHLVVVKMEDVMDKLKLLDYEAKFCRKFRFKPFSR